MMKDYELIILKRRSTKGQRGRRGRLGEEAGHSFWLTNYVMRLHMTGNIGWAARAAKNNEKFTVRDGTRARECELIVAVLTRIYQQRRKDRDVGGCQTMYMIISRMH